MSVLRRGAVLLALAVVSGCGPSIGGSQSGDFANAVGAGTAPYALLDLASGAVSYRAALDDVASNPAYRAGTMVFRRVGPEGRRSYIGVFELTQAQWQILDASTPWTAVSTTVIDPATHAGDYPAYNLAYLDLAAALAAYAPAGSARLAVPTATQWEDAAGATSGYAWGAAATRTALSAHALVRETALNATNAAARLSPGTLIDIGGPGTVGALSPTGDGIYDIHGNVWEWTAGGSDVRGGSWYDAASLARIDVHAGVDQGLASDVDHALIGARLVLVP